MKITTLEMHFLGGLALQVDGQDLSQLNSQKGKALLCYLAVTGKAANRPVLAGLLWSDMPESQAAMNLRKTLYRLNPISDYLRPSRQTVAFNREAPHKMDVAKFEAMAEDQAVISGLQEAVSLYRGDFLEGFYVRDAPLFEEWVAAERARLRELYVDTLQALIDHFEAGEQTEEALVYSEKLVNEEPFREDVQRDRLRLLARSGRRSEALTAYESLREMLTDELGIEPDVATTQLVEEIKTGKWAPEAGGGKELDKDTAPKQNLPAQATPFIGRTRELDALEQFLGNPALRLINIIGPGGMGKTSLALAAAEGQLANDQRFMDGVYFVPLAGVEAAETLPQAIAEAINFPFSGTDTPQDQLQHYLSTKEMLLVLDNFEHLLAGVEAVEGIVKASPGVKLLVTSRAKLRLQAEQLLPISGLDYPKAGENEAVEQGVDLTAVALFVERARSVRPYFKLTAENYAAVASICRQVEGMPLGIVLAAAWIDMLTVDEIAHEIKQDLDFLAAEMGDIPARQRSLRAAFNHSWRMLNGREQEVLSQLSVFRGGFTAEAARAVTKASLRDLQVLANKSLLTRLPGKGKRAGRYAIHELLRQFAAQELAEDAERETAARHQHSRYYCELLQQHEAHWHSSQQLETVKTISRESDNITVAWQQALEAGDWEHLDKAIDSWGTYHLWRGLLAKGRAFCEVIEGRLKGVLAAGEATGAAPATLLAKALAWAGRFIIETELALAKIEESLRFVEQLETEGDDMQRVKAFILRQRAWRFFPISVKKSRQSSEHALRISLQLGDAWQEAECISFLALADWMTGQYDEACKRAEASLAKLRIIGDRRMQVQPLIVLGLSLRDQGQLDEAIERLSEALELCQQFEDRTNLIYCTGDLSTSFAVKGQYAEARNWAKQCVALCTEYGHRDKESMARVRLAYALLHLGQFEEAYEALKLALALSKESGNQDVEANVHYTWGYLALTNQERFGNAREYFAEGVRNLEAIEGRMVWGQLLAGIGIAACLEERFGPARRNLSKALNFELQRRDPVELIHTLPAAAFFLVKTGGIARGLEIWGLANAQFCIANSHFYSEIFGPLILQHTTSLPEKEVEALMKRGRELDLWLTAEMLLAELHDGDG